MKIALTKGGFTEINDEDAPLALAFKWRRHEDKRAKNRAEYAAYSAGPGVVLFLHRLIMKAKPNELVDHKDGDGLNNKRDNLRLCTQSQNRANGRQWKSPKSGFRGVYQKGNRWTALISQDGNKLKHLGTFIEKEDAAKAYDRAATERWGEFARLNFPKTSAVEEVAVLDTTPSQ